jgi:hypothetical protein
MLVVRGVAVDTVIVDGRVVVHEGRIQTMDGRSVLAQARAAAERLATRAGVSSLGV